MSEALKESSTKTCLIFLFCVSGYVIHKRYNFGFVSSSSETVIWSNIRCLLCLHTTCLVTMCSNNLRRLWHNVSHPGHPEYGYASISVFFHCYFLDGALNVLAVMARLSQPIKQCRACDNINASQETLATKIIHFSNGRNRWIFYYRNIGDARGMLLSIM